MLRDSGVTPSEVPASLLVGEDEYRRRFELEGEAALLLRLNMPEGDPWRPDPIERRAALAWILENRRDHAPRGHGENSFKTSLGTERDKVWWFTTGLLLGMLLGAFLTRL